MHRKYENSWWWRHSHVCWARKLKFSKNTQSMVTQQTIPKVTEVPLQRFIQHLATKITQQTAKWLHSNNTNGCWAVETNVTEEPCGKWHCKQIYVYSQTQCLLESCRKWSCKQICVYSQTLYLLRSCSKWHCKQICVYVETQCLLGNRCFWLHVNAMFIE